ncbi:protein timeless homolog isoform X2 [Phymastichus coffea]|uniref:protein timeless homolog isoform X2 n=1 Tax=Phymastichus coffea TaxID=108790 RepID=UPI00273B7B42|nr:protein timeless homolog isoform X2 [Phymastichus coffea]
MPPAINQSARIFAEITATCDALGYNDGKTFRLDKNSLEALKDLIRYLRRDDDTHSIRRYLGQTRIVQKDLIKIFVDHAEKTEIWNVLLRLLINLTSPALMVYNEELPSEKVTRGYYLQILSHLQEYKAQMTNDAFWVVVNEKLKQLLIIDSNERGEDNEMLLDRILTLIRNVLRIPGSDYDTRTDNDTSVHDQVLFTLHTSGVSDMLIYISSSSKEQQYHMQILEIIAFMLQGQNPSKLAQVEMLRSAEEKEEDEAKLMIARQKEKINKMAKIKKYAESRHSRFGGTYVVKNMKAIGENEMICHKPYKKIEDLDFSVTKRKTKKHKARGSEGASSSGKQEERLSALSVRLFLKEFCVEFLAAAYNPVMRYARSCINGNQADASHYLWALRFFMNFNRHYKFRVKYVSETISSDVFYTVQRQIEHHYDMICSDKKKATYWAIRLHLAVNAYQELLYTLIEMDKCADQGVRSSSRVIMSNIFYVPEYRETIFQQLLNYNELTMSKDYLVDLVTTVHIFLKMLKNFCDKQRHLVVAKPKRNKSKKKTKPAASKSGGPQQQAVGPARSLEDRWDEVGPELSAVMQQNNEIPIVMPFDATIDIPVDEQKVDAMKRIQKLLRSKEYEQTVGLLRAARDVWPENESFGKANIPVDEEFLVLREIFLADLGVADETAVAASRSQANDGNQIQSQLNCDEEADSEENEEAETARFKESSFKFMDFMQRFANVRVVSNLNILLKQFEKNAPEVNYYVLKILHRISFECKMTAMMYQASIFRVFQRLFRSNERAHQELAAFGRHVFRSFAEVASRNPKAYMELLFWKSTKQAVEMTDGYDVEHANNKKASKNAWTEQEEDELRLLFMEHQTNKYPQDVINFIQASLINQTRTRRAIIRKLKEMCLIVNSKGVRSEIQKRLPKEWSEEEKEQLAELWQSAKDEDDPVGWIYDGLRIKRSKLKIKEKLLELQMVEDPKQLRKKRSRKSTGAKSSWETRSASEDENDDSDRESDDSDGTRASHSSAIRNKKQKKRKQGSNKKNEPVIAYTDAQLSQMLKEIIGNGMRESLEWLKESLEDSLEDRDEESNEGIALVPLTANSSTAMDSPSFQRFLHGSGMHAPNLEETYWRIPATMLVTTIKKRIDIIDAALKGDFIEEAPAVKNDESSDDDDIFEKLRQYNNLQKDVNNDSDKEAELSTSAINTPMKSNSKYFNEDSENSTFDKDCDIEKENLTNGKSNYFKKQCPASNDFGTVENITSQMSRNTNSQLKRDQITSQLNGFDEKQTKASENSVTSNFREDVNDVNNEYLSQSQEPKSKRIKSVVGSSDSEDDVEKSLRAQNDETIIGDSSEDSENEKMDTECQSQVKAQTKITLQSENSKSRRIRKIVDSDSESEAEKALQAIDKLFPETKRNRSNDCDTETPVQKKRRILDSDDEDVAVPRNSQQKKQTRVMNSDED